MSRHPVVADRTLALSEPQADVQIQRGLYTTLRGVRLAIPRDRINEPRVFLNRTLWKQDSEGRVTRPGVRMTYPHTEWQRKTLDFLRDHVHKDIPNLYYRAMLGHDLHYSTFGNLYARHYHHGWANPFDPDRIDLPLDLRAEHDCDKPNCPLKGTYHDLGFGFIEDCGWLSGSRVGTAFVTKECVELAGTGGAEYADFDFHEVGLTATADATGDTALLSSSGIARVTGTPTPSGLTYASVATVTADSTETWNEHGIFCNSSGVTLMDRSAPTGQAVNNLDQVQYTYTLTKAVE